MSGIYNMINGTNENYMILIELLGIDIDEIERFRDIGVDFENNIIWIYTRTGGGNRPDYPNKELTNNKYYIKDFDDKYDNTYSLYEFDTSKFDDNQKKTLDIARINNRERPDWNKILKSIGIDND